MVIISNVHNTTINANINTVIGEEPLPEWEKRLLKLLREFIEQVPPKQLGREMRDFFMMHIANLQTIPPGLDEQVLQMLTILSLIDHIEDNQ